MSAKEHARKTSPSGGLRFVHWRLHNGNILNAVSINQCRNVTSRDDRSPAQRLESLGDNQQSRGMAETRSISQASKILRLIETTHHPGRDARAVQS